MPYEIPLEAHSFIAGADLSALQYHAVKLNTSGQIVACGDGESAIGILQDDPESGKVGRVMTLGITYGIAGDAITAGSNVASDANSELVTAGGGDAVIGVALETAATGDAIAILLTVRASAGTTGITAGYAWLAFKVDFADMDDVKIVNDFNPGFTGTIDAISLVVDDPTTDTADSNFVVTPSIGGTDLTGGVLTLDVDVAGTDPDTRGKVIDATAITADNDVVAASDIDLTVANTANAFTDGSGTIFVRMKVTA